MANGDIVYARFTVELDINATDDTAITTALTTLLPSIEFDIINTSVISVSTEKGKSRASVLVTARDTT